MSNEELWEMGINSIHELEADQGILASARDEAYGCVFGRDSLVTSLMVLSVYKKTKDQYFLDLVNKILRNLAALQGKEVQIESGEEPGKMIHEYRPDNHDRLSRHPTSPWFIYPDNTLRNYDTVDATSLYLWAVYEWSRFAKEEDIQELMRSVHAALHWVLDRADHNSDGFIDYRFPPERRFGGLRVQNWMDSIESLFYEHTSSMPLYPIAPVEVQAYTFVALRCWSDFFKESDPSFSRELQKRANRLKRTFNERFVNVSARSVSLAFALDGEGRKLSSPRSSMAHVLWATYSKNGVQESILEKKYIARLVKRLMAPDLFVPSAGLRTLSTRSKHFQPMSYHNGSIWPHDTEIFAQGLQNFGYTKGATRVRNSLIRSYTHFKTPIELFVYKNGHLEYVEEDGRSACRTQAWSAAALLELLSRIQ